MAIPDIDIPIRPVTIPWEYVMKAERAVEEVQERLRRTVAALNSRNIPYAVVGGNAVAIWVATKDEGAIRATKDVDILVDRRDLLPIITVMDRAGFQHTDVHGVSMFIDRDDPIPSRGVHLVFAQEKVRPQDLEPTPAVKIGIRDEDGAPALDLPELLTMKLIAFRDLDRVHIRDMLRVGLIGPDWVERVPAQLRSRLEEILANPDG